MIVVHLDPGPRGHAVLDEYDSVLAKGLTHDQAMKLIRGGRPIEDAGNGPLVGGDNRGRRVPRHVRSHNEAQAPWDYMLGTNH
jgi:hypothetical protein